MNDNLGRPDQQFDGTLGSLEHQRRHETFISSAFDARELKVIYLGTGDRHWKENISKLSRRNKQPRTLPPE